MDELEGLVIRECAVSGGEGILFGELMGEVGRRCGNAISAPLQTLLWRRVRLLTCVDFSRDALDRDVQLQAEPRLEPGTKGQPTRPIPCGEPIALDSLPERLDQVPELPRLRLTANAQARMKELSWLANDSVQSVRVLEVIARSREKGILQSEMATATGLDAKSVFYYMKPLKARELIDLTSVTIPATAAQVGSGPKHIKTNMVYLKRFAPAAGDELQEGVNTLEDPAPIEVRALQFLRDSPAGIAAESLIKKHAMVVWLGTRPGNDALANPRGRRNHMWERVRRGMQARGLIHRIMLRAEEGGVKNEGDSEGDDTPQAHQQEIVCLKLLDSSAAAAAAGAQHSGQSGNVVMAQVSLLEQMFRAIHRAGSAGILQSDLHRALGIDQRIAYDQAFELIKSFGVQPSPETVGRQTQYRLTFVGAGSAVAASAAGVDDAVVHVVGEGGQKDVGDEKGSAGGEGSGGRRVLTREWVVKQETWKKGTPCTEQWLRRGNAILARLDVSKAMTSVDVNPFLNSLEKLDRDKSTKVTKVDYHTSRRLVAEVRGGESAREREGARRCMADDEESEVYELLICPWTCTDGV
jgi:hypothetical protein